MLQVKHKEIHLAYYILFMTKGGLSSFNSSKYDLSVFMVTHCDEKLFGQLAIAVHSKSPSFFVGTVDWL